MTTDRKRAWTLARVSTVASCSRDPDRLRKQAGRSHPERSSARSSQKYQSFGFVEHPDTDKAGYTTLTTRFPKDAVTREMLARGYTAER